jgi:hypothetical protein
MCCRLRSCLVNLPQENGVGNFLWSIFPVAKRFCPSRATRIV